MSARTMASSERGSSAALERHRAETDRAAREADDKESARVRVRARMEEMQVHALAKMGDLESVLVGVTGRQCSSPVRACAHKENAFTFPVLTCIRSLSRHASTSPPVASSN